jgi:hypothetical protein
VHSNCSEAVCLAAKTFAIGLPPQYREVSTRTILPNIIGNCRDSIVFTFWRRHRQKREEEEAYVEDAYARQVLSCFDLANQNSPAATAVRYNNYYIQLVAIKRDAAQRSLKEGAVAHHCIWGSNKGNSSIFATFPNFCEDFKCVERNRRSIAHFTKQ